MRNWTVITPALLLAGCSAAELVETASNAKEAAGDAITAVASDPSKAFTPEGLGVLLATFITGFYGRQGASWAKWLASGAGGALVKFFSPKKDPPAPVA